MIFRLGCTLVIGIVALSAILRLILVLVYLFQGEFVNALNNTIYVLLLAVFALMVAFIRGWWKEVVDADPDT